MRTITSKENFVREYTSLLNDIDEHISNLAHYERTPLEQPDRKLVDRINTLKIHRKKLKDTLAKYTDIEQEHWPTVQARIQEIFDAARDDHRSVSEEFTST